MTINLQLFGEGIPVVFFHGWGFDYHVWQPLIAPLSQHYQLILVDLPGFGLTLRMDWDIFKKSILNQLPEYFAVVGWSLGGLYAQRLAIEVPTRVTSIMNITSSPRFIADELWPAIPKASLHLFYKNLAKNPEKTLNNFIALQMGKSTTLFSLGRAPSMQGLEEGLNVLNRWDLREQISDITQPTCYLFGRLDPIVPAAVMNVMKQRYEQFEYIFFRHAAHMPFLSHMNLFIDEFKRFIR